MRDAQSKVNRRALNHDNLAEAAKLDAAMTAAYVLEVAGLLDPTVFGKFDQLNRVLKRSWVVEVEARHRVTRQIVQNLYAVLLDLYLPHEALPFILRGLGFTHPERYLDHVLSLSNNNPIELFAAPPSASRRRRAVTKTLHRNRSSKAAKKSVR